MIKQKIFPVNDIRGLVPSHIYTRGLDYFRQGRVEIGQMDNEYIRAKVRGSHLYDVVIHFERTKPTLSCTCPYAYYCKHIVAVMLAANQIGQAIMPTVTPAAAQADDWKSIFKVEKNAVSEGGWKEYKMIFLFSLTKNGWKLSPEARFLKKDGSFGRKKSTGYLSMDNQEIDISSAEKIVVKYLTDTYIDIFRSHSSGFDFGTDLGHLLQLLKDSVIFNETDQAARIRFYPNETELHFRLDVKHNDYCLSLTMMDGGTSLGSIDNSFKLLTSGHVYFFKDNTIYHAKNNLSAALLKPFSESAESVKIPAAEINEFLKKLYPKLIASGAQVQLPETISIRHENELTARRLYLREEKGILYISARFVYGKTAVSALPFKSLEVLQEDSGFVFVQRQQKVESFWTDFLGEHGLAAHFIEFELKSRIDPIFWLFDTLPVIAANGFEIFGEEKLDKLKVRRVMPKLVSRVKSGEDWFDLKVELDFEGMTVSVFEVWEALKAKQNFIRLNDGSAVRLDEEILSKIGLITMFGRRDAKENSIRFSKTQAILLDQVLSGSAFQESDEAFKLQLRRFKEFDGIENISVPRQFKGELRPYQKAGLDWLVFLNKFGFGGCLADDMGLGKTVQALALLQKTKNEQGGTSLILAPTSVVHNWQKESQHFTPKLKLLVHSGVDRVGDASTFVKYDVIITSYAIILRDYDFIKDFDFNYLILDESQKIKNPHSITAQCARGLRARHRLVMTGTPIENNLTELWSQFNFLNAGMLGSLTSFEEYYGKAIQMLGDQDKAGQLKRMIYPFILRRTKEDVAKELPPKVENVTYCDMDEQQTHEYNKWRDFYRAAILNEIQTRGMNRSKMKVLEGLTKLRQLSIHPKMVDESYTNSSGKFDLLWDSLEDIMSEKHKVLLFSQFVKALKLVRERLDSDTVKYAYLDGSTRDRQEQVDLFQRDASVQLFLISLKAGGLGLNLTAADYVIHLDPWWNPAVEMQASDRAHRIGQDKKVFVYKLITRDTVEEKVLNLQEKKKKLVSEIISTDAAFFKSLNKDDIEQLFS